MNVRELQEILEKIEDKNLEIRLHIPTLNPNDEENFWLSEISVHDTGDSGYEMEGEVQLIGVE